MWSSTVEMAAGAEVRTPPSEPQSDHPAFPTDPAVVFTLTQSALSPPRAKTATLPRPYTTADGSDVSRPPRDDQPVQSDPVHELIHRALSAPRPKTSRRLRPLDTIAGAGVNFPRNDSQQIHCDPSHILC